MECQNTRPDPEYVSKAGEGIDTLIKTASFDNDCPPDKISIISREEGFGHANVLLDVCGKKIKYKRTGTIYHKADKAPY
jgi:hypothetical protein